jgi:hypothetical protein
MDTTKRSIRDVISVGNASGPFFLVFLPRPVVVPEVSLFFPFSESTAGGRAGFRNLHVD